MTLTLEQPISMEIKKNRKTCISPKIVFVRPFAKEKCVVIRALFLQQETIIDVFLKIKNEYEKYLMTYEDVKHFIIHQVCISNKMKMERGGEPIEKTLEFL